MVKPELIMFIMTMVRPCPTTVVELESGMTMVDHGRPICLFVKNMVDLG